MRRVEIDMNPVATTKQVAAMVGVSEELVRKLARLEIIPKSGRNQHELRKTLPAIYRYIWRSRVHGRVFGHDDESFFF